MSEPVPPQAQRFVDAAIVSRRSVRAFLPTPVPREKIEQILTVAARAPSGTNIQPWKVHVVTGMTRERLCAAVTKAHNDLAGRGSHVREYDYYPQQWVEPYLARRRKVGWDLYGLLGIGRDDKAGMHAQHGRNFQFFDAPVGLIFTIDRILERGSWLDFGMFLQNIMVAARGRGLDTCPQAAWASYPQVIAAVLDLPSAEMVVCGMALGHADSSKAENSLQTEREPVSTFARFLS